MVTHPDTMTGAEACSPATEEMNDLRIGWTVGYRRNHPEADRWTEEVWTIEHGLETQERVFRMVEQRRLMSAYSSGTPRPREFGV